MKKNLSLFIVLSSFVFLVSLGIVVFNDNLVKDTTSQLASVVGPLISNVKVSKITLNGATISWTTDIASTSKLETKKAWTSTWILATDDPANTTDHSIEVGGLIQNTKYSYRVTSCDNTNTCKTWTSSNKFTTAKTIDTESPSIPTNLAVSSVTDTTAVLNWTPSTDNVGVTGYNLYKKDSNGTVTKKVLGNVITYNVSGLTPGQERSFWLEAFDAMGNISATSNAVVFTTTGGVTADTTSPTAPTGLTSSNITQTGATISWTASTDNVGVTGYDVYKNGTLVTSVTNTTASLTGLTAGTTYSITVKAKDAAGNVSPASNALLLTTLSSVITPPADTQAPSTPTLTLISKTDISAAIQWTASTDNVAVAGYHVYNNGGLIGTTSIATSITVSGLNPATTYNFTVKAFDTATPANVSLPSNILSITTDALHDGTSPTAPSNLTSSNLTPNSVDIAWTASTDNVGVVEYQVYVNGTLVGGTTSATSIHVSNLSENTPYTFTISSKDAANNYSPLSTPLTITTTQDNPLAPTNLILISKTHNSAAIQWTAPVVTGGLSPIASYEIYVNGTFVGSTLSQTSITANGLAPATTYIFTVKAKNSLGHLSSSSNSLSVTTDATPDTQAPTAPTGLNAPVAEITTNSINLYWTASTDNVGVVEYQVFKNGVLVTGTITSTSVPITGLTPATTYTFTVKAKDAAGNLSPLSASLSATTKTPADTTSPTAPTGLTSSNITQTGATISWTASTDNVGVTGYDVYKNGTLVTSVTNTTASLTGLTAGTTYSITVKAKDAAGNSSVASTALSMTTVAADTTAPTISAINSTPNDTGVTITWTTNEASDSQISYGLTTSYGTTSILNTTLLTNHSVTITGLTSGTLYHFKVISKDASANSASSTDQIFTTTTPSPVCLNAITNPADGRDVWAWHGNTSLVTPNSTYQNEFFAHADANKVQTIYLNANTSFLSSSATNIKDFLNKAKAHCMEVEALGGAENWIVIPGNPHIAPSGVTLTPGTNLDTDPKNLRVSNVGLTTATLSWDAPTNTTGLTGYNIYKSATFNSSTGTYSGTKINSSVIIGTSYNLTGLTEGNQYTYIVKRVSTGGVVPTNESSNILTFGLYTNEATAFATAVKNFNNSIVSPNAKFSAVQYDVEPHTINLEDGYYPYYGLIDATYTEPQANQAILNALIDMTQAVRAITGSSVKVNLAPPRWYDSSSALNNFNRSGVGITGKNAMQYLFDNVDILSIQDYVNTAQRIHDDAAGELQYAAANGKKVNIGILLDNSAPASSNFYGSTCANLNSTLQAAYNLMTATEKNGFGTFAIEQYDTGAGYSAGTPSSWSGMCP